MAEFLVRFVFEIVVLGALELVARLGRLTARAVVPLFSVGRVLVEPSEFVIVRRWHGIHHLTDGTPVIGRAAASTLGILLLVGAAVIVLVLARWF
jgi:hypothetical protein